jgi:hypothetical protein
VPKNGRAHVQPASNSVDAQHDGNTRMPSAVNLSRVNRWQI